MTITERLRMIAGGVAGFDGGLPFAESIRSIAAELDAAPAGAQAERAAKPKMAPVQGYSAGIPWAMHLEAYDAYCKRYGSQPALIDLEGRGCRGGFCTKELDDFIPGWRERVSIIAGLRERITGLEADLREEQDRRQAMRNEWGAEADMLTSQAQFQAGVADALKARVAELDTELRVTRLRAQSAEALAGISASKPSEAQNAG